MPVFLLKLIAGAISSWLLFATPVSAADSTSTASAPSVAIGTAVSGSACTTPGAIAKSTGSGFLTCVSGVWTAPVISNPVHAQAAKYIGPSSAEGVYAACPAGKKVLFTNCLIYLPNGAGVFYHDEQGPAGGLVGYLPTPGDSGGYCLYISGPGAAGYVVVNTICGDK